MLALGYRSSKPRAKGWISERITAGAQDVQSASTLPSPRHGMARPCGVQGRHGARGVCVRAAFLPGRVGVALQPDPSRRPVRKTQASRRVRSIAGGHAAPELEPTEAAPRRGAPCTVSRCARPARKASPSRARPRSDRTGARRSRLPPGPGPGGGRGAGRPSRTDAGDSPVDPPGWRSESGRRPGGGPARAPPLALGARRPGCPPARRTDPARPAVPTSSSLPVCGRPARLRALPRSVPRKDGPALHRPRAGRNRYPEGTDAEPWGSGHRGPSLGNNAPREG